MLRGTALLCALLVAADLPAQSLSGSVVDQHGKPLASVTLAIPALQRWTSTDSAGSFSFKNLPNGSYVLEASRVGYAKEYRQIILPSSQPLLPIVLSPSAIELPLVTVTAEAQPAVIRNVAVPTTVIGPRVVALERGASLGQTIEDIPGVSGFSGGPLAVKPVIHGLTGQRVLVLSDGERLEGQTWDEPQSPEIDMMDVDHIEIVRGAGSVLYGSDALGGVVNAVRRGIPSAESGSPALQGTVALNAFSNNPQGAGSLSLSGFGGGLGYRANLSTRFAGDYTTPAGRTASGVSVKAGSIFNSGAEEFHGSAGVGITKDWGTLILDLSHFGQNYQIAPEPGRMEYEYNVETGVFDSLPAAPHQEIFHEQATATALIGSSIGRLEFIATFQRDSRKEEGVKESEAVEKKKESLGIKPEVHLVLSTFSLETKLHHNPTGALFGTFGIVASLQSNETDGQKPIVPAFSQLNIGGYAFEVYQGDAGPRITAGLRYDSRQLDVDANTNLGNASQSLSFRSLTATAGASWMVVPNLTVAANAGRAWRAPVAAELFFSGADEGAVRYKIGSPNLRPEESLDLEGSIRFSFTSFQGEISVFRNAIERYIFLSPVGFQVGGLDAYLYGQADATLSGGEAWAQAELTPWLFVDAGFDLVRGTNEKTHSPLPLVPADRMKLGARFVAGELWGIRNFSFALRAKIVLAQNRLGPFETATPAYALTDFGCSGNVFLGGQDLAIGIWVRNALNRAYYDHLSRYKMFALNPGRNIALTVSTPFRLLD